MIINPCPFCANTTEEVFFTEDYFAHVICRPCGACGPSVAIFEMPPESSARERAISLWNTRTLSPPSSDDKSPHSATGEAERGLLKEGDKVKWATSQSIWVIQTIHPNLLVDILADQPPGWSRVRYEDLELAEDKL